MNKNFGMSRVLEPKGTVPAIAWKLDNSPEISDTEILVELDRIHIEWDSFQQLCNSCSFQDEKIKEKIIDIVNRRGKLHNPFTGTGGSLEGTVKKIGKNYTLSQGENNKIIRDLEVGDKIYSLTSLRGLPIYIESIESINYKYGHIICSGHGILFQASPIFPVRKELDKGYTLSAINEGAFLIGAYNFIKENGVRKAAIVSRNTCTTLLFAQAIKYANSNCEITSFMDKTLEDSFLAGTSIKDVQNLLDNKVFLDFSDPFYAYENIISNSIGDNFSERREDVTSVVINKTLNSDSPFGNFDMVIVAEDMVGAETVGVLAVKPKGKVYFTAVNNYFPIAQTVAETLSKDINILAFDQYLDDYMDFTYKVVEGAKSILDEMDESYIEEPELNKISANRTRSLELSSTGKNDDFVYQDSKTAEVVAEVMNVAKYDCNVIIQGETGVGKEKILSLIHKNSERQGHPCIKINCATIQESLAESEFFGYEAGAFTGAKSKGKPGYFEMANTGILFLDEIGTLSMNMQSKLLRVLQESTFYRVGGTKPVSVNVRVIAANNIELKKLVAEGKFREDLFYRLNICSIDVPPLRERKDDIECLSKTFCQHWSKKYRVDRELSPEAVNVMKDYPWYGNVRELENVIHRLVIGSFKDVISEQQVKESLGLRKLEDTNKSFQSIVDQDNTNKDVSIDRKNHILGLSENQKNDTNDTDETRKKIILQISKEDLGFKEGLNFRDVMEAQEKTLIEYALQETKSVRAAAKLIGLPQTTFVRKKEKHRL